MFRNSRYATDGSDIPDSARLHDGDNPAKGSSEEQSARVVSGCHLPDPVPGSVLWTPVLGKITDKLSTVPCVFVSASVFRWDLSSCRSSPWCRS